MITIKLTTSTGIQTYQLDIPITDTIELHYDKCCKYCDVEIRTDSIHPGRREFCNKPRHRIAYCEKRIALAVV